MTELRGRFPAIPRARVTKIFLGAPVTKIEMHTKSFRNICQACALPAAHLVL